MCLIPLPPQESGLLPVLSRLISDFNPSRQSRAYACDLVMALHYVLRMYDRCEHRTSYPLPYMHGVTG